MTVCLKTWCMSPAAETTLDSVHRGAQRKPKPGRKALNDVLVRVVGALKAPNRRDGLKFGIFIVRRDRTMTLSRAWQARTAAFRERAGFVLPKWGQ